MLNTMKRLRFEGWNQERTRPDTLLLLLFLFILFFTDVSGQTVIPNPGFESWTTGSYSDPVDWDTPNQELMAVPFFGITVVTKSTDHHGTGNYSARLETKNYLFSSIDVPGFMTCGNLVVDLMAGTYVLSGGVPVVDIPTHLKGFYKYLPKGGDSCVIGIGLTRTTAGIQDTIGMGYFSTKDTVTDWTPFSAWIDYQSTEAPDTMNIIAMSTAQEVMTVGTVLFVDDLYLDYTVGVPPADRGEDPVVYNDRETSRLLVFFDQPSPADASATLFDMTGRTVFSIDSRLVTREKLVADYGNLPSGIYLLHIRAGGKIMVKKYFLHP